MVLIFSRISDRRDETTAEVQVTRLDGAHVLRRRINLLSSGRGSAAEFAKELAEEVDVDWRRIIREACESVLDAHRSGPEFVTIAGDIKRPSPPEWLCDGLMLKGKPNCWLAAASTGKSTLAKAFCTYYATGYQFCDRRTEKGVPLYLDWEDDEESFRRVAHDVCRNLSVWPVPPMYWRDMHGQRFRDQVENLGRFIDQHNIGLVVIDAIAAAGGSPGEHMSWEAIALELEQGLGQLPPVTVLGLDHVTSDEHKNGGVPVKGRGAERKVEFFRNQWSLLLDRDALERGRHLVGWTHTKVNAIVPTPTFVTELAHRDGELSINPLPVTSSPTMVERMTNIRRLVMQLEATPGLSAAELCEALYGSTVSSKVEGVRTELRRAEKRHQVRIDQTGRWWALGARYNGLALVPKSEEDELPWQ